MSGNRKEYSVEFPLKAGPDLIFNYLATASGLAAWFADDVNVNGDIYEFEWDGAVERAQLVKRKPGKMAKFHWLDREGEEYLTLEIAQDELTSDVALVISDYEEEDEIDEAKMIWSVSVDTLRGTIGA